MLFRSSLHDFDPQKDAVAFDDLPDLDKYMLHRIREVFNEVTEAFDSFQFFRFFQTSSMPTNCEWSVAMKSFLLAWIFMTASICRHTITGILGMAFQIGAGAGETISAAKN